jgi:hypothetical protein
MPDLILSNATVPQFSLLFYPRDGCSYFASLLRQYAVKIFLLGIQLKSKNDNKMDVPFFSLQTDH